MRYVWQFQRARYRRNPLTSPPRKPHEFSVWDLYEGKNGVPVRSNLLLLSDQLHQQSSPAGRLHWKKKKKACWVHAIAAIAATKIPTECHRGELYHLLLDRIERKDPALALEIKGGGLNDASIWAEAIQIASSDWHSCLRTAQEPTRRGE